MNATAFPKTIIGLVLLFGWAICLPPATANPGGFFDVFVDMDGLQTVEVQTPRGSYNAVVQSEVQVFPNGTARGFLMLSGQDGAPEGGMNIHFAAGRVRFHRDGTVARVLLLGLTEEGDRIVVRVSPGASEDCLIYDIQGNQPNAQFEAEASITVNR